MLKSKISIFVVGILTGLLIFGGIVLANNMYNAVDINYKNEEFGVENVNEALDKLYSDMTVDLEEVYTFEQLYNDRLTLRSYVYTLNKGIYYLFVAGTANGATGGIQTIKVEHDVQSTNGTITKLGSGVYKLSIENDNTTITINYNTIEWLGVGQYVYYGIYK